MRASSPLRSWVIIGVALVLMPIVARAETAFLVADVARGPAGSSPFELTPFGSLLVFTANDDRGDFEVWRTDGTTAGTALVKDINPTDSSFPREYTVVGDRLFFLADDGTNGEELWSTDGTTAGTMLVKDINPDGSGVQDALGAIGGVLLFAADDGVTGGELWRSDGTSAGTTMVKDINPNFGALSFGTDSVVVGDTLFFFADDGTAGTELWRSNGTADGTVRVKDIALGGSGSQPFFGTPFGVLDGKIFFFADDGQTGEELWMSDGTDTGTVQVKDINNAAGDSLVFPAPPFVRVGGALFFTADDGVSGEELWKTDGSPGGTVLVEDIVPGDDGSSPDEFIETAGVVLFSAFDPNLGRELWRSDGTAQGTFPVRDLFPGPGSAGAAQLASFGDFALFAATDGTSGVEVWRTDGTTAGTVLQADVLPGGGHSNPGNFVALDGVPVFSADDGVVGRELWVLTSCGDGTLDAGEGCDDGNRISGDCCSAQCTQAPAGQTCDDGNACTAGQVCDAAGTCGGGGPLSCDDGVACTADRCDPTAGCQSAPVAFETLRLLLAAEVDACAGTTVPSRLTSFLAAAGELVAQAESAPSARQKRLLRRAGKRLGKGGRRTLRFRDLPQTCRDALVDRFVDAAAQAACLRG